MFLWFIATTVAAVVVVFRDPAFDYRLLIVGALLPDVLDAPFGGAGVAHSVTFSVVLLFAIVLGTSRRGPRRTFLLALPIGMLLHLVFDGAFANTEVFWWPFSGERGDDPLPVVARGRWNVPLEFAGAALCWIGWQRAQLSDASRRQAFLRTGVLRLDR